MRLSQQTIVPEESLACKNEGPVQDEVPVR